jgi:signal peptidase I
MNMDFALIMLVLLMATGTIWGLDRLLLAPRRRHARAGREPIAVEYARAFFPVILIVFLLRSFLVEPFRIPSGSMLPSLLIGDFILVNKFSYGIRLPVANVKIVELGAPKRGDVMVFRFPGDLSINYIKRVIGLPGDRIVYKDKRLLINGKPMEQTGSRGYALPSDALGEVARVTEDIGGVSHDILLTDRPDAAAEIAEIVVPEGHYFVMGDNRDHSNDSRYWGFVPDRNLVGKAFLIWFSWDERNPAEWFWRRVVWSRIGTTIQ